MGSFPLPGANLGSDGFDLLVICAIERVHFLGNPSERETSELFRCPTLHALFDDGPVTEDVVREAARAARGTALALRDGRRVLVTCNAGRNRSGLVVVLALLALFPELAPADAVRIVRERRVSPDGARALTNEDFVRLAQRGRAILRSNQSANWEK